MPLVFESRPAALALAPNRADIACFVGYVARRADAVVPAPLREWLEEQGWRRGPYARPSVAALLDVPIPIDAWATFDALFAWDERPVDPDARDAATSTTYLGAAVRSFFAQGGRTCYVVRVGEPWPLSDAAEPWRLDAGPRAVMVLERRRTRIGALVPGFGASAPASPADPTTWRGVAHLYGLPEVSFLCLPDLADICASLPEPPDDAVPLRAVPEVFVACADGRDVRPERHSVAARYPAPRCDDEGYTTWGRAVAMAATIVQRRQREVQVVAALPLSARGTPAAGDLDGFVARTFLRPPLGSGPGILASSFIQLVFPWVRTPGSANLPEGLESPDGVLAGVLARSALTRGSFRSVAGQPLAEVYDVEPLLRRDQTDPQLNGGRSIDPGRVPRLAERVSLLGRSPAGLRVLTDVTASHDPAYRPAGVHRLVSSIVRAARRLGEDVTFEPSGERLWARVEAQVTGLLEGLYRSGALRGVDAAEAYRVRCDRTTMTQADIDAGRAVVEVQFEAAMPIERITVVLALDAAGQVLLVSRDATEVLT